MELIQIGENALKVTLTREDMQSMQLVFDDLDYRNAETRRALRSILDEAKRTLGFSAPQERLYIQAFADKGGGCELFVRAEAKEAFLFRFRDMQSLLLACARLLNCGFAEESRAYAGIGGDYYLKLAETAPPFLSELGTALPLRDAFLAEHASPLCDNAVQTLGVLR